MSNATTQDLSRTEQTLRREIAQAISMQRKRINAVPTPVVSRHVVLDHVTNTGSTTSVTLAHGGHALGENECGIVVDRACRTKGATVVWRAGVAPAGTWTLSLKKKAAGSRTYQDAATMTVTVNHG